MAAIIPGPTSPALIILDRTCVFALLQNYRHVPQQLTSHSRELRRLEGEPRSGVLLSCSRLLFVRIGSPTCSYLQPLEKPLCVCCHPLARTPSRVWSSLNTFSRSSIVPYPPPRTLLTCPRPLDWGAPIGASAIVIGPPVAICHDQPGLGPTGTLEVVPLECLLNFISAFQTLSTARARIAGNSGIGMYLGFLFGFGASQADRRFIHVAVVTVPSPYPFLPNPGLSAV